MRTFSGAWPALITPFNPDGSVNLPVLRRLVDYLIDNDVDGFYVCGTTGEGIYMPIDSRKLIAETVMEQVNNRVPVIVHVGCVAVEDAAELARHAQTIKAEGVSSILPPLYKNTDSLYQYYKRIRDAAPDLPILTYIFGGPIDAVELMTRLMEIPNVAGAKYTGPDMYEFSHIVQLREQDWTVFSGMDEQCIFAAMFGSSGNIGSTVNFMPRVYKQIRQYVLTGNIAKARDLQVKANEVTRVVISFGFMGALKEVMQLLGFDCGEPLLPNLPMPSEKRTELEMQLEKAGFWELAHGE